MRKRHWLFVICMCAIMVLAGGFFSCNIKVYAEEEDHPTLGYVVPKGLFEDGKLYVAIASVYANDTIGTDLYNNGKVYYDMLKVADIKKLDLSGSWNISSVKDFNYLDVSGVEILDLSFNDIAGEVDLTRFTSLKKVNLAHNNITGIKVDGLENLEEIILNSNNISSINLQNFKGNKVDLSNNNFNSISNITLPTKSGVNINLVNNGITDVTNTVMSGSILNLGAQIDKDLNKIVLYKLYNDNIKAVITGEDFEKDSTQLTGECETIQLLPGTYTVQYKYVADDSKVYVDNDEYKIDTVWKLGYQDREISTKPDAPTYTIYVDGKAQTSTVIHKNGELKINTKEGVKTLISYNETDWMEYDGSSIKLEKKTQKIYTKSVHNNVESEVVTINIIYEKQPISGWLTIILLLLFIGGFIAVYWLIKKYVIDKTPSIQE